MKAAEIERLMPKDLRIPVILTRKEADLVKAVNLCLRPLKPLRGGQIRRVYIPADKGTPSDLEMKCHYVSDHVAMWKAEFPDSQVWYMLDVFSHGEIAALYFSNRLALYTGTIREDEKDRESLLPLLEWILDSCTEIREMMLSGTYHDYLESCFPVRLLPGIMKSSDYWRYVPLAKAQLLNGLCSEEIEYFIRNSGLVRRRASKAASIEKLGILASACSRALGGRPFTFLGDDAVAVTERVYLLSKRDESGYYIELGGGYYEDTADIVSCFNALHRTSFPVICKEGKAIRSRLTGEALLAVVPETVSDWQLYFRHLDISNVQHALQYPRLPKKTEEEFRSHGKWEGVSDYSK